MNGEEEGADCPPTIVYSCVGVSFPDAPVGRCRCDPAVGRLICVPHLRLARLLCVVELFQDEKLRKPARAEAVVILDRRSMMKVIN